MALGKDGHQYFLGGASQFPNARLNLQHFLLSHELGDTLIDPTIPHDKPDLTIGDICCGTGIWLTSLHPHTSTKLYALDIDLNNLPPSSWLSHPIESIKFNIYDDPPTELLSTFDILNISLVLSFLKDSAFDRIAKNFMRMLKPGGYIQWTEFNIQNLSYHLPNPNHELKYTNRLMSTAINVIESQTPTWPAALDAKLAEVGFADVYAKRPPVNYENLKVWTDVTFMTFEEMRNNLLMLAETQPQMRDRVDEFGQLLQNALREWKETDVGVWWAPVRATARKPLEMVDV